MIKKKYYTPVPFSSIREMTELAVKEAGDKAAYQFRISGDEIKSVSYKEFYDITENLGAALCSLGYKDAHIACMGENSFDWICAFVTVLKGSGVFVPIDAELPTEGKIHILTESESSVVFFSNRHEKWIRENMDSLPNVDCFIGFGVDDDDGKILSYSKLIQKGMDLDKTEYDNSRSDEHDLKLLVYTSGTTGIAKGVMLTEHNLVNVVYNGLKVSQIYDKGLSVLPYHHTYESVCDILVSIHFHSTICINQSMKDIVKDMKLFKPSYVYIVPALAEHLYAAILKTIKKQGKEKQFNTAVKISKLLLKLGIDARKKLFSAIHQNFGGRLIKIVCGGAPIRPEIGEFFGEIGIYLIGGYGITECSPLVSVNDEACLTYNTVGHKLPCVEWKIDSPNEEGIGEICVKGDTVMKGYYKQEEKTAEVLKDGWFFTGDYGYITDDDQLVITGRKKNIIVLSNGKNIYPEEIENYIQKIDYISEVVVSGFKDEKGLETCLKAEVFLDEGVSKTEREILTDIQKTLSDLPSYKHVQKLAVRNEPFPKTTTNKIKRNY